MHRATEIHRVTPDILRERSYLTPSQAALLYGHGTQYWALLFDRRVLTGYTHGKRRDRHINHASIRQYLAGRERPARQQNESLRDRMREFRENQARRAEGR